MPTICAESKLCPITGKLCYPTKRLAKLAGFQKQREYGRDFKQYKCECGKYHLYSVNYLSVNHLRRLAEFGLQIMSIKHGSLA